MITLPHFPKLARQNIIVIAACMGALLLFAGAALIPNIFKHRHQVRSITELQAQLKDQNELNSLYQQLTVQLAIQTKLDTQPPAKPAPLPAQDMSNLVNTMQELAAKQGVIIEEVRPAIKKGSQPLHRVRIQAILHGHLEQHRALLLDLLREPYVHELEQLTFEANGSDITLRIIMAINIA